MFDGTLYNLDVNKYSSEHHGIKNINNVQFCGDLPKSYKYFYDDEIKKMIETFYEKDIQQYGYSFDDFE